MPGPVNETPNPCPWCGSQMESVEAIGDYKMVCESIDCDAQGPFMKNEAEAIAAWNRVAKANEQTAQSGSEGR